MVMAEPGSAPVPVDRTMCTVTFGRSTIVGRSLVAALLSSHRAVHIVDPAPLPADSNLYGPIRAGQVSYFQTDLSEPAQLLPAVAGSVVVFHIDPAATVTNSPPDFHSLHCLAVRGTKNLLSACREAGVQRLVYTGSADVVFDGVRDVDLGDESLPYPDKFRSILSEFRAQVEMMVLSANGSYGLWTCVLRPSNTFGPGDLSCVPFLIQFARSFYAKFIVGSGKNICDFTYVENVAHANICAEKALCLDLASVAGKTFFITNQEPIEVWDFISTVLEGLGYQRPTIRLPVELMLLATVLIEEVDEKLGLHIISSPLLTPAAIYSLSSTRTFNSSKAKGSLGYSPPLSLEDGIIRTVESFSELANDLGLSREQDFSVPSKASKFLGGGVAADILLWRDEKKTFAYVTIVFFLFYWFLLSERTFISSMAKILLLLSVTLFVHGMLPSSMFGLTFEKISADCFEVSESTMRNLFLSVASAWNQIFWTISLLAKGDEWRMLFKAIALLCSLKMLFSFSFEVLIGLGLVCMFAVFTVYEQCEAEVDKLIAAASFGVNALMQKMLAKLQTLITTYVPQSVLERIMP